MYPITLNILPNPHQQQLNLLHTHPKRPRQHRDRKTLQPSQHILSIPQPNRLISLPFSPRPKRPLIPPLLDIHEASLFEILFIVLYPRPVFAEDRGSFDEEVGPFLEGGASEGVVDAAEGEEAVLQFEVASWAREGKGGGYDWDVGSEAGC
jgi:hypothetical protein